MAAGGIGSTIGLGSFSVDQETGRTKMQTDVFGLDYKKMADDMKKAYEAPARKYEDKVSEKTQQLAAFKPLMEQLRASHDALRKMTARTQFDKVNAFSGMIAKVNGSVEPMMGLPSITISDSISNLKRQNLAHQYTLQVTQVATKDTGRALTGNASPTAALGLSGQISLGVSGDDFAALGAEYDILLDENDTLLEISEKINRQRETTRISAQVLKTGGLHYLSIQSDDSGQAYQIDTTGVTLGDVSLLPDQNYSDAPTLAALEDTLVAKFSFNGFDDTRLTNTVDDLVPGLVIGLNGTTNQTYTIDLVPDVGGASQMIEAYRDAHNALMTFLDEKTAIDPETHEPLEGAIFAKNRAILNIKTQLKNLAGTLSQGAVNGSYQTSATVGLKMDPLKPGHLEYFSSDFIKAFEENPEAVQQLFTFQHTFSDHTGDDTTRLLSPPNRWITHSNPTGNDYLDVIVTKDIAGEFTAKFDIDGTLVNARIIASANSLQIRALEEGDFKPPATPTEADKKFKKILAGMVMSYTVDPTQIAVGDVSWRMTGSQGALDIHGRNLAEIFTVENNIEKGSIFAEQNDLSFHKKSLEDKVKTITKISDSKIKKFEEKMSRLQSNLAAALQQLARLDAFFDSMKIK